MKSLFYFKLSWLFAFAIVLLAFVLVLRYYRPPEAVPDSSQVKADISTPDQTDKPPKAKGVISLDIDEDGNPLGVKTSFGNPDYVFCHLRFEEGITQQQVTIQWLQEGELFFEIRERIDAGKDVMWSKLNLPENKKGEWRADIRSNEGLLVLSIPFHIKG